MPLIARRISDGAVSSDFQTHATAEILVANAVAAGFATEDDLEVVEVTLQEFQAAEEAAFGAIRAAANAKRIARRNRVVAELQGLVGKTASSLTQAEVRLLVKGLAYAVGALDENERVAPLREWLDNET